eukprot:UN05324
MISCIAQCWASSFCLTIARSAGSAQHPIDDIEARIWKLARQFDQQPVTFVLQHPDTHELFDVVLNGERFLNILNSSIYFLENIRGFTQYCSRTRTGQNRQLQCLHRTVHRLPPRSTICRSEHDLTSLP